MISFVILPIGAICILVLRLLAAQKRMLVIVFFGTLALAFFANIVEWVGLLQPYAVGGMFSIDNFTRFFTLIFVFVTALSAINLFFSPAIISTEAGIQNSESSTSPSSGLLPAGRSTLKTRWQTRRKRRNNPCAVASCCVCHDACGRFHKRHIAVLFHGVSGDRIL